MHYFKKGFYNKDILVIKFTGDCDSFQKESHLNWNTTTFLTWLNWWRLSIFFSFCVKSTLFVSAIPCGEPKGWKMVSETSLNLYSEYTMLDHSAYFDKEIHFNLKNVKDFDEILPYFSKCKLNFQKIILYARIIR